MGLLLGCSLLTLCEFLDLIVYNMFTKVEDQHHKRKSASPLTNPNAESPPPNYDTISSIYRTEYTSHK